MVGIGVMRPSCCLFRGLPDLPAVDWTGERERERERKMNYYQLRWMVFQYDGLVDIIIDCIDWLNQNKAKLKREGDERAL